jgi:hypothetical protein
MRRGDWFVFFTVMGLIYVGLTAATTAWVVVHGFPTREAVDGSLPHPDPVDLDEERKD